jgi:hypothetical protein
MMSGSKWCGSISTHLSEGGPIGIKLRAAQIELFGAGEMVHRFEGLVVD